MLVWFLVLALGGLVHIVDDPSVLHAINPLYGIRFLAVNGLAGIWTLGYVFLAVTGAEALYADLGLFGRKPIQRAWLAIVFPALTLNYLGQGALVLTQPNTLKDSFYNLYPSWALVPMLLLATLATIIASQAVISGTFSLTPAGDPAGLAAALRYSPYLGDDVWPDLHPARQLVPDGGCRFHHRRVPELQQSGHAYGVAVTANMIISSLLAFILLWRMWQERHDRARR